MEEEYNSQLGLSMTKYLAEESLRGEQKKPDGLYKLFFDSGIIRLYIEVPGSIFYQQVESVPAIIGKRIKETLEPELHTFEEYALNIDSNMSEAFMKDHFDTGKYQATIECAERLIQSNHILRAYGNMENSETLDYKIRTAEQKKQHAHICWENPDNAGLIMRMEQAHKDGNIGVYEEILKELSIELPK